jgi:hypothetical protein
MVIPGETMQADEQILSAIEGHFISRGLRVVSSAITGRVVSSAAPGQVEGAAKLPTLERALVLPKGATAECVFYLLSLDMGTVDLFRYLVWPDGRTDLVEVDRPTFDAAPPGRKWFVGGSQWEIDGKVVDVDHGSVLTVVSLKHSTPFSVDRQFQVEYVDQGLVPVNGYYG